MRIPIAVISIAVIAALTSCSGGSPPVPLTTERVFGTSGISLSNATPRFRELSLPSGQHFPKNIVATPHGVWVLVSNSLDLLTDHGISTFGFPANYTAFNGLTYVNGAVWAGGMTGANSLPHPTLFRVSQSGQMQPVTIAAFMDFEPDVIIAGEHATVLFTISDEFCGDLDAVLPDSTANILNGSCPHPSGVAVGPDHNLYVNRLSLDPFATIQAEVQVLSTNGSEVNTITLPDTSAPQSIVTGPDGALWITLTGMNAIGRLTIDGTLRIYPLPTPNAFKDFSFDNAATSQIISGTNDDLWFIENTANKIGRISTAGIITEYAIPTPNSAPSGISLCQPIKRQHECVWFGESAADKIGQLTL